MNYHVQKRYIALFSLLMAIPLFVALVIAQRFTHTPWYFETARTTPQLGLNYEWGSINWMNIKFNPMINFNVSYTDVEFEGPFGSTLRGWYVPAANPNSTRAVVGVHGAGLDRREFLKLVPLLHDSDYHVLLFDCREHGISTGSLKGFSYGIREHADVIYAVKYMKKVHQMRKIAVIATSQGATSTILAASKENNIDAVIAENPFASLDELFTDVINGILNTKPDWSTEETDPVTETLVSAGRFIPTWYRSFLKYVAIAKLTWSTNEGSPIAAKDVVSKLKQPLFLIHGTSDSLIPIHHTIELFQSAHQPKQLWVAEGCEHAAIYNKYPKEYAARVVDFLKKSL